MAEGTLAQIGDATPVWTDTLMWTVVGTDETPPGIPSARLSAKNVEIGHPITITTGGIQEPGPLSAVMAYFYSDSTVVDSVRLTAKEIAGISTGIFEGTFTPSVEADFEVRVTAADVCGNVGVYNPRKPLSFYAYGPFVRASDVLLYAASNEDDKACKQVLQSADIPYDFWNCDVYGIPDQETLMHYVDGVVIWASSWGLVRRPIREALQAYLDVGGNLLLAIRQPGAQLTITGSRESPLYNGHLHAHFAGFVSREAARQLIGVPGDPVTDDLTLKLDAHTPLGAVELEDPAAPLFTNEEGQTIGFRVDTPLYKALCLGFGFEDIPDRQDQRTLLEYAMDWLYSGPGEPVWHDVALERIRSPVVPEGRERLTPEVTIRNLGESREGPFSVSCTIARSLAPLKDKPNEPVYADTQTVYMVEGFARAHVTFRGWIPEHIGAYDVMCAVDFDDGDPDNNRKHLSTIVTCFSETAVLTQTEGGQTSPSLHSRTSVGVAFGDYDGDGDPDLYVVNRDAPNVLYRNDGDGAFSDVTAAAGVGYTGKGRGVIFGDYDNDGHLDLYVTNDGPNVLYRNNGDGTFSDVTSETGTGDIGAGRSALFGDYDRDGDLDLYVVNADGANVLYWNQGGAFVDVASQAGVADSAKGCGAASGDYDRDGDLDLYVVNFGAANVLYRNEGDGRFSEVAVEAGVADSGNGVGTVFGDYDHDGLLDIYVTNHGANVLYRNNGDGTFSDATLEAGVGDAEKGVGTTFIDYDNDGFDDLYVVNWGANVLYRNNGDGTFADVTFEAGVGDRESGWGVTMGDYNGDGYPDLYIARAETNVLYTHRGDANHWLMVRTVGTQSNTAGIGAQVRVVNGDFAQIREVSGGSGYCSQNSLPAAFGLGTNTHVDSVIVRWPSGTVDVLLNVACDQVLTVQEGSNLLTAVEVGASFSDAPTRTDVLLLRTFPNPTNGRLTMIVEVPRVRQVSLILYNLAGQKVRELISGALDPGRHQIVWDGNDAAGHPISSGVYWCRLRTDGRSVVHNVVVLK